MGIYHELARTAGLLDSAEVLPANTAQIEENNDPRDSAMYADDDDHGSMPDLEETSPNSDPQYNPWQADDPDEADISNFHLTQTGPARFNVQATFTRSVSPQGIQAGVGGPASIGGFMNMLNGIVANATRPQGQPQGQTQGQSQGQGEGLFPGSSREQRESQDQNQSAFQESRNERTGSPQIRTGRFTYHGGARLYPRDFNVPQPRVEPVDNIARRV